MIIIGAKGFAKQLVEIFFQQKKTDGLYFFDDVSSDIPDTIYGITVLRSKTAVKQIFADGLDEFCLGLGTPQHRKMLTIEFESLGGKLCSVISKEAHIASHVKQIGKGVTILGGVVIENDVTIQNGVLLNSHCSVHHDVCIGAYSEVAPGARLLGNCNIGNECIIGANAVILPKLVLYEQCIIGAGAVVTKNVQAQATVVGVPAKPLKYAQ